MDRVLVRSFRAHDLAERGLKDLARSRLDTTRDVVFQPLGARFFEAREDVVRLANLFREDAFHAPAGNFARLTLRVEPQLVERLSVLDELRLDTERQSSLNSSRGSRSSNPGRSSRVSRRLRATPSSGSCHERREPTSFGSSRRRARGSSPWRTST